MVIALLLSDAKRPVRYQDLGRVALQCLYGVHSMWKALTIFQSASKHGGLESSTLTSIPPGPSPNFLSAFDAHVGDCACQIRAQMLWELLQFYHTPEKNGTFERAITMLQEIRMRAALLMDKIEQGIHKPRKLNPELEALKIHLDVWQRIGFTKFLDSFDIPFDSTDSVAEGPAGSTSPPNNPTGCIQTTVRAEWDVNNPFLVARFLTICLLLSEHKTARIEPGLSIRVIVRLDLRLTYEEIGRELEALNLSPARRHCEGNIKMKTQCNAMQHHVSAVTTEWVKKAALRLGFIDFRQSLTEGLIIDNGRRVSCAAYVTMLLMRRSWLTLGTPLLVVIQRFCSHGEFHNIYYRVVGSSRKNTLMTVSLLELGESDWFNVTFISAEDVATSSWAGQPHIVMICMSGDGTIEDYRQMLLDSSQGKLHPSQPNSGQCQEIADLASKINKVNFARFLAHYFAHHDQFPFALPDKEDEFERVSRLIQKGLGKRACDNFKSAREGADNFGTGTSTRMFTIEHIVLGIPRTMLTELQGKPGVYGCRLES